MAVTSPPYFSLRSYLPKDHPLKALELGSEPTPELFIANLLDVFRAVRRVLRDDGTLWVNMGDSYADDSKWGGSTGGKHVEGLHGQPIGRERRESGLAAGNRVMIPEKFAIAMQEDGWILRDVIIWHKPAPMPSSVNGWRWERCRVKVSTGKYTNERQQPGKDGVNYGHRDAGSFADDTNAPTWEDCPGCPKCKAHDGYVLRKGNWRTTTAHEYIYLFAKTDMRVSHHRSIRRSGVTCQQTNWGYLDGKPPRGGHF